ncbi:hypothetical protein Rt10032_c09g4038 [Rhodotorula toruloides]|uniref:Uncharacterized protein n=1 Tax=Rhodotorula toruloides TaxID=5286 RepID=A0A511KI14_RHOTO|nr:hypothetical protein Rt10032_c09g4038 [Rhodotorula toruloides]
MATALGALTPWLHREFLSQRNAHGDKLPTTPVEEGKRVQLIRATGKTAEKGEALVWAEVSDGELWIDCCIPLPLVEQYDSKIALSFAASSQWKCIFRLLSWRFVIASPLIPSHGQCSPRKLSTLATSSTSAARTQAPRVCLRIESFKHFGMGEGTMQADCTPFRHVTLDPMRMRGEGKEDVVRRERERVVWVRRLEDRARGVTDARPSDDEKATFDEQVAFVDDLPQGSTATTAAHKNAQGQPVPSIPLPSVAPPVPAARPGWPNDKNAPLPRIDFGEVEALLNRYKRKQWAQHDAVSKDKGKGKAKAVAPEPALEPFLPEAPLLSPPARAGDRQRQETVQTEEEEDWLDVEMEADEEPEHMSSQTVPRVDKGKKRASPHPSPSPSPSSSTKSSPLDERANAAAPTPKRRRLTRPDSPPSPRFVPVIPLDILDYAIWSSKRGLVAYAG